MRKIAIAVAAALVAAVAAPAFATEIIMKDGKLTGGYTFYNGQLTANAPVAEVKLAAEAQEDGGWKAEAELGDLINGPALAKYKVEFTDPLFRITGWGRGYDLNKNGVADLDKKDPLEFVGSSDLAAGDLKLRAEAGPVTVDVEQGNIYLFGEKALAGHKVGLSAHKDVNMADGGTTAVGYAGTNLAGVTLTGALGATLREGEDKDHVAYGAKVEVPVPVYPGAKASVSYKHEPVMFYGARNTDTLKFEGSAETELTKGAASYAVITKADDQGKVANVATVEGYWRGSEDNQAWDDLFDADKYHLNVAPAVYAGLSKRDDLTQPATEITLKGVMPVLRDRLWVNGSLYNMVDDDANAASATVATWGGPVVLPGERQTKVTVDGYLKATDKMTVEPGVIYVQMNQENERYSKIGSKVSYQVAPHGKITAEYARETVRTVSGPKLSLGYEVKF